MAPNYFNVDPELPVNSTPDEALGTYKNYEDKKNTKKYPEHLVYLDKIAIAPDSRMMFSVA